MSINAIGSLNSLNGANSTQKFDPAKMIDAMTQRFIKKNDTDGNGTLGSQEVGGLSSDAFKALDANGDGQLNSDEIKSAMQKFMDEMKQAASSSDPASAMQALQKTPEGQLMQMMRAGHHHGQQGQGAPSGQGQPSSIEITINQTIYNNTGQSQSSLDVTT